MEWLITKTRPTTFHPPLRPGPAAANHHLAEDGKALPDDIRRTLENGQDKYLQEPPVWWPCGR